MKTINCCTLNDPGCGTAPYIVIDNKLNIHAVHKIINIISRKTWSHFCNILRTFEAEILKIIKNSLSPKFRRRSYKKKNVIFAFHLRKMPLSNRFCFLFESKLSCVTIFG